MRQEIKTFNVHKKVLCWDNSAKFAPNLIKIFSRVRILNQKHTISANLKVAKMNWALRREFIGNRNPQCLPLSGSMILGSPPPLKKVHKELSYFCHNGEAILQISQGAYWKLDYTVPSSFFMVLHFWWMFCFCKNMEHFPKIWMKRAHLEACRIFFLFLSHY